MKWLGLLALAGICGCAAQPPAICMLPRSTRVGPVLTATEWYHLLVERALDGSAADCTGAPIAFSAPAPDVRLATRPFSQEDLVISPVDSHRRLVWVITGRFSGGDGMGPVALVRDSGDGPQVIATGSLRAGTRRVRLALAALGAGKFLVADGESCRSASAISCRRSLVVVALTGQRFAERAFYDQSGKPAGPARIELHRERVVPGEGGARERFELNTTVDLEKDLWTLQESMTVSDFDVRQPGLPPRLDRRADAVRTIREAGGRLVQSDTSLWSRMVNDNERTEQQP